MNRRLPRRIAVVLALSLQPGGAWDGVDLEPEVPVYLVRPLDAVLDEALLPVAIDAFLAVERAAVLSSGAPPTEAYPPPAPTLGELRVALVPIDVPSPVVEQPRPRWSAEPSDAPPAVARTREVLPPMGAEPARGLQAPATGSVQLPPVKPTPPPAASTVRGVQATPLPSEQAGPAARAAQPEKVIEPRDGNVPTPVTPSRRTPDSQGQDIGLVSLPPALGVPDGRPLPSGLNLPAPSPAVARIGTVSAPMAQASGAPLPITPAQETPPDNGAEPLGLDQAATVALARLRAGDTSPEVVAALSQLERDRLIQLLLNVPLRDSEEPVAEALVQALVVGHDIDLELERRDAWPSRLALRVGRWLARRGDKRCIGMFEDLLGKYRQPLAHGVPELAGLATYYRTIGAFADAGRALLRTDDYSNDEAAKALARLDAARDLMRGGETALANRIYAEAERSSYGWAAGLSLFDRAQQLIHQGEYDQALRLLARPITGEHVAQVSIALAWLTGLCHEAAGDGSAARQWYAEVLRRSHELQVLLPGEGLETMIQQAQQRLGALALDQ